MAEQEKKRRDELLEELKRSPGKNLDARPQWIDRVAEIQVQTAADVESAVLQLKRSTDISAAIMIVLTIAILVLTGVLVWTELSVQVKAKRPSSGMAFSALGVGEEGKWISREFSTVRVWL